MSMVSINFQHLGTLLVSAVRYALGRRTYIVSETVELVRMYRSTLSESNLRCIIKDIELQARHDLGGKQDKEEWTGLLAELRGVRDTMAVPTSPETSGGGDA